MFSAIIAGGGPVGLFLGLALVERGIQPRVFERRARPRDDSRSIGLHPPALELLENLGLIEPFLQEGVRVQTGHAFAGDRHLGRLSFRDCRAPHRYVLSLPQHRTEALLRQALQARAPGSVTLGAEVEGLQGEAVYPHVHYRGARDVAATASADVFFDCEGRRGRLREQLGIHADGRTYPGHYAMADGPDDTGFGRDAAVFLHPRGQVESFPLPAQRRRWVALLPERREAPATDLATAVLERAGHVLDESRLEHASYFQAERWLARRFTRGRIALAGDAAHVVSPIGGQGTNLGLLGAQAFAEALVKADRRAGSLEQELQRAARLQRRRARAAIRRSELNMWLGRRGASPVGKMVLSLLLSSSASGLLAHAFSMRGLTLGV